MGNRPATLRELDRAGLDLRAWCFRCARGERVDSIIWQLFEARGWADELAAAALRFRCTGCGRADEVALYPARRPQRAPATAADLVAGYFHACRSEAKRRQRAARRVR